VLLTLLLLLACSSPNSSSWSVPGLLQAARAQQPMPFIGNGDSPPAVPGEVHVTAYLDRLLNVDDKAYEFQVRLRLMNQDHHVFTRKTSLCSWSHTCQVFSCKHGSAWTTPASV
jgi:hypothetical protein